jgi:hypothetical protein
MMNRPANKRYKVLPTNGPMTGILSLACMFIYIQTARKILNVRTTAVLCVKYDKIEILNKKDQHIHDEVQNKFKLSKILSHFSSEFLIFPCPPICKVSNKMCVYIYIYIYI